MLDTKTSVPRKTKATRRSFRGVGMNAMGRMKVAAIVIKSRIRTRMD